MTKSDLDDLGNITPYQARLYNAVLYGNDRARRKNTPVLRRLWASRRWWQARAIEAEARLALLEGLCTVQQLLQRDVAQPVVRVDLVLHAVDPDLFPAPAGWDQAVQVAAPAIPKRTA